MWMDGLFERAQEYTPESSVKSSAEKSFNHSSQSPLLAPPLLLKLFELESLRSQPRASSLYLHVSFQECYLISWL